ncbi:VWA domain-containing protein [Clostridium cagae]|uniref:VWA domain-containing protein n=1 Tax=Clostridium cagae TaxID=2080751 RepID=UPI003F776F68
MKQKKGFVDLEYPFEFMLILEILNGVRKGALRLKEQNTWISNKRKRVFSCCMTVIFIIFMAIPIIVKANSDVPHFNISMSATPENAKIGEDIVVTGTIMPQDFTAEVKPKEVILVLDTSGSMIEDTQIECTEERKTTKTNYYEKYWNGQWYAYNLGYYTNVDDYCSKHRRVGNHKEGKIDELKKSTLTFIDRLKDTPNLKISIVDFNTGSIIKSELSSDFENLKMEINKLSAGGGTNIGGGLRQAAYLLSNSKDANEDRYLVFMTDGDPRDFSTKNLIDDTSKTLNNIEDLKKDIRESIESWYKNNEMSYDQYYKIFYELYYWNENTIVSTIISDLQNWNDYKTMNDKQFYGLNQRLQYMYYNNTNKPCYDLDIKDINHINYSITGSQDHSKGYAMEIGRKIKDITSNVYSIGYDLKNITNIDATKTLKDIHNSMTNKEENFFESGTGSLEKIFSDIADKIVYSATDVKLNLDFPESIEIIGNQKVIPLDNIVYKEASRSGNIVTYHAESINFDFIIRGNTQGDFNLFHNAKITFMWDGEPKELPLDDLNVTITDPRKPKVIIKASDSAKTIEYDSSVKANNTDENYKLYGKSTLQIDVIGVDAKYLRYRFNSKNEWKYMELNRENDIDKEKPNYLTQMSYDVSHMPLRSNEEMWNNRNEVFKEPFFKDITQISTKVSSGTKGQYVEKEEIKKESGNTVTRWKPKTLFVENYDVSLYAPDYKEASKSWGYMTVPEDGEYTFKAITDDGFYGNITVDGESKVIGDAFRVKWYKDQPPASEPIKLKKGEYYPVYFEYFNWGGAACYKIECSKNGDGKTGYKEVGKMGIKFYPSKSNLPTLDANNGFMGSKFIDIPTEIAKYTLEY